jgi:hypothetical protein
LILLEFNRVRVGLRVAILANSNAMQNDPIRSVAVEAPAAAASDDPAVDHEPAGGRLARRPAAEIGGPPGPEPTRFGDWEKNGRCIDF